MLRVHCAVPEVRSSCTTTSPESFGDHGEGETPGPIPNPEAKPFCADGTARETAWESRTSPDIFLDGEPRTWLPIVVCPAVQREECPRGERGSRRERRGPTRGRVPVRPCRRRVCWRRASSPAGGGRRSAAERAEI